MTFILSIGYIPSQYGACPQHSTGNIIVNFADLILFSHLTRIDAEKEEKNKNTKKHKHK